MNTFFFSFKSEAKERDWQRQRGRKKINFLFFYRILVLQRVLVFLLKNLSFILFLLYFFSLFYNIGKRDSPLSPSSSQKILLPSLRDKKDKLLLLRLLPCVAVHYARAESDHSLLFRFFSLTYSLYLRLNDIAYKARTPVLSKRDKNDK